MNEANEILYQKLIDNENLEMEFNRLKQIKVERPLNDMKSRIKRRHKLVSFFRWGIAATILVLMVWGSIKLYNQQIENELLKKELCARKIQPGQTQATLVLSNGESIDLGMNSTENQKKLVMQKQKLSAKLTNKEKHKGAKNNLLITPKGGEFKIILEDSTEVWLNAESKLIYPEFFGKDEIEFYYKLDENGSFRMLTQLRIKHGKKKSIEEILKEEFAVEDGANHFTEYCEGNHIPYEMVTI